MNPGHHARLPACPLIPFLVRIRSQPTHDEQYSKHNSTPKVAVNDIGSEEAFLAAIDETIKYFNDGDIVEGTVVKVDRDEVLLDIGYKTEGVIPVS